MRGKSKCTFIILLGTIFLTLTYICVGFACVAGIPFITERAAIAAIDDTDSPFNKAQLVDVALATREYSFGNHDLDGYLSAIVEMNNEADTPYAGKSVDEIVSAPIQYSVNGEQIDHLDDVFDVSYRMFYPIIGVTVLAVFLLMVGLRYFGVKAPARMLFWSGLLTLAVSCVLVFWAASGFEGFFTMFHSAFFDSGTWTFPADSLLITMLPQGFWMAIASVWMIISVCLGCISLILGIILRRRAHKAD